MHCEFKIFDLEGDSVLSRCIRISHVTVIILAISQGLLGALVDLLQGMMCLRKHHPHRISCCLDVVFNHFNLLE